MNQLETGEVKHAYLFCGGAGTGKTTSARIFAKEVNEGHGTPIEIDAASNNGVENVRDIIEDSKFKSLDSRYKVYIIDEVHMLSTGAFNALLKTLEEPPAGTIFILCTTDPQKIPATIMSRVQRFDFTRIPNRDIVTQLAYILESENEEGAPYSWTKEALAFIGKLANGGMRDAITRLEKVLDYASDITVEEVASALGTPDYETFVALTDTILSNDTEAALRTLDDFFMSGKDLKLTMRSYTDFLVDVCKYVLTEDLSLTSLPDHVEADLQRIRRGTDYSLLLWMLEEMNKLNSVIKWEPNAKPIIEAQILLMTQED
jgi:DNA polymerase III, subunit gamma and tau|nr:MAG TPA: DNA polymerase III [Caudoviricetes sp.]